MLCENCGKHPATTHIRTVVNGKVTEQNLCESCAAAAGFAATTSLDSLFSSLFGEAKPSIAAPTVCPDCSCTFAQISASGKLGCPTCYKTFYHQLLPYIKRVHGGDTHVGLHPDSVPENTSISQPTVAELRAKLEELVRLEKYEEAAGVRDEIRRLESEAEK